jgi:hypothetical protein
MSKVTIYSNNSMRIDGLPGEFLVEQKPDATRVYKMTGHGLREEIYLPRVRYALAVKTGLSLAGAPGRDVFDSDLLSMVSA